MTTENKEIKSPEQIQKEQMHEAQIQHLRNALVQGIFSKYYEFINALKLLPVQQQLPGMLRAYGHIDDGMLWVKEILNTAPLVFVSPPPPPADENKAADKPQDQEAAQTPDEKVA